jgi:hypothetical protein
MKMVVELVDDHQKKGLLTRMSDEYETPEGAWGMILKHIPDKRTRIYEPFYCTGRARVSIQAHGFSNVIHERRDFFSERLALSEYDVIVTNPPYSKLAPIFKVLKEINKPFAMLVPLSCIATQYFQKSVESFQLVIPKKRMDFIKDGTQLNRCNFETVWVCSGLDLPATISYEAAL